MGESAQFLAERKIFESLSYGSTRAYSFVTFFWRIFPKSEEWCMILESDKSYQSADRVLTGCLSALRDLKMLASALLLTLAVPGIVSAATLAVIGQVPCHGSLRLLSEGQIGASPRSITIRPTGTVVLSLRTNCAYQITAEWIGTDGEARISAPTVTAAAGMGHLAAHALQPTATAAELKSGVPAVCLEGRAVSRGGNDITPDNAILIEL